MAEGAEDSDDKTEDPSQRRLDEAREKGQVASSREVNHLFMLLGGTIIIVMLAPSSLSRIGNALVGFLDHPDRIADGQMGAVFSYLATEIGGALAVPMALMAALALLSGFVQHGVSFSIEPLMPDFSKISPGAGFSRLFSTQALAEFVKGLFKLSVVGSVAVYVLWPEFRMLDQLPAFTPMALLQHLGQLAAKLMWSVLSVVAAIAALDMLYQRFRHMKGLRMSRQELKEEMKQSDGDPHVKARLRQLRMERTRTRMMAKVPEATVIVTNPTHFAVALKYVREEMEAPIVVAKGADFIALKIREIAGEHEIPIVENPPLARALYATCEIDQTIRQEHYKAVAEIIGYVMRLKPNGGSAGASRR
ncbi:MAG TPA: flagellar biosynthesis protein FlhB [Alphaproteobacteria bacterium]|jgi:flagellar biosynthetic protein FlhB|nr:flagellar biosynthesis protein FlhB [Alphaproteobacteria bacterium]